MATNVTEKDKTLNEIIDMCVKKRAHYRQFLNDFILTHSEDWHDSADVTYGERIMFLRGKIQAFEECAACCESMLGYSGSMSSEVPNQSEDAKNEMETGLDGHRCKPADRTDGGGRGRNAPPADAEVEAVAKKLLWWDTAPAWKDVMHSEDCFWNQAEPEMRANYIRDAREMLEIARKAVTE